jgi:hypothetical protein
MSEYLMLITACIAFVGSHFFMSHPMRAAMIRTLKPGGFALAYSVISLVLFYWMVVKFNAAPKGMVFWPVEDALWGIASLLTLIAAILFVGSLVRNPSFPGASEKIAAQKPFGVFDNFIFAGSIIFLALVGAKAQELKKAKLVGVEWDAWLRRTSYGLQLPMLLRAGALSWIAGIILWAAATWGHQYLGIYGAGMFRWING